MCDWRGAVERRPWWETPPKDVSEESSDEVLRQEEIVEAARGFVNPA